MTERDPGGTLLGYPKGVFHVAATELWERFSYWGLMAIFVLFLTAGVGEGGFGWERADAMKLYGAYVGAAFAGPLIGGWIANNYWGERRCILIGGLLIVAGHLCLAGPAAVPWLAERMFGADVQPLWQEASVSLGQLSPSDAEWQRIAAVAQSNGMAATQLQGVYRLITVTFTLGLLLVITGTGLIKPTISSIISHFFVPGDNRRDGAFGMFFVAIYVGCILGIFVVGYLGERVGWHWGFAAAAVGMLVSLLGYLWKQDEYLGDIGRTPANQGAGFGALSELTREEKSRIRVLLWQAFFTALYAAAFFQAGGLLLLFAAEHLDRQAGGWTIPASWLVNVATIAFVALTPLAIRLWSRLDRAGRDPGAPVKLAWGLLIIGAAYLLLACVSATTSFETGEKASWLWMVVVYLCFGIGDVLVWPNQISLVSRLAPLRLSAVFVGGWYVTIGVGTWLTGYIGALGDDWGLQPLFLTMALVLIALGFASWRWAPSR
jgi:POT family proton-dependent oligopeptide transporter